MDNKEPSFAGEVMLLDWSETAKGGAKIVLQLDGPDALEPFRTMTLAKRGTAGQRLMAVIVEVVEDETPQNTSGSSNGRTSGFEPDNAGSIPAPESKPFGKQASELYRAGFFYVPAVLEAIGTDAEFLDWIRAQPCAVTGKRDYHKDEATGIVTERCDPAHVRRIANGAGVAEKPPYSAIPLLHVWHDAQTKKGEGVFAPECDGYDVMVTTRGEASTMGKEWMDKKRNEYVVKWASTTLAEHFKQPSMGFVTPSELRWWAKEHNISQYLPEAYR